MEIGLMSLYDILNNKKKNVSLYYNRLTVINNLLRYQNNYCWIHETTYPIQPFPNILKCNCFSTVTVLGHTESTSTEVTTTNSTEVTTGTNSTTTKDTTGTTGTTGASTVTMGKGATSTMGKGANFMVTECIKDIKDIRDSTIGTSTAGASTVMENECMEVEYIRKLLNEMYNNIIIDFKSSQCISIIYKNHIYLYSNLSLCKFNAIGINHSTGNISTDNTSPNSTSNTPTINTNTIGNTNTIVNGNSIVNSNGIVNCNECRIIERKEFTNDEIQNALYEIVEKGEDNKYGLTLLEHSNLLNLLDGIDKIQHSVKSIGILEGLIETNYKYSNIDNINVIHCNILLDEVNVTGSSVTGSGPTGTNSTEDISSKDIGTTGASTVTKGKGANFTAMECTTTNTKEAPFGAGTEGVVKEAPFGGAVGPSTVTGDTVTENLILECIKYANELIEKVYKELNSICSSLINEINIYCQPPLNISIRFLKHYMCFEYLLEYNCDLNNLQDTIYGININKENVILHEFIQPSLISINSIHNTFNLLLTRIKSYIINIQNINNGIKENMVEKEEIVEKKEEIMEKKEEKEEKMVEITGVVDTSTKGVGLNTKESPLGAKESPSGAKESPSGVGKVPFGVGRGTDTVTEELELDGIGTPSPNKKNYINNDILKMCDTKIIDSNPISIENSNTNTFNNSENTSPNTHSFNITNLLNNQYINSPNTIDKVDKVDGIDGMDGMETLERIDSVDGMDRMDSVDTVERMDTIESVETIEPIEPVDTVDTVDNMNTVDTVDKMNEEDRMEIIPYWWRYYVEDNTLGEGDVNGRYESIGIRRFTRSYLKEESSTPKNKKHTNGANYLLTRSSSSDFSTKSNVNLSRETITTNLQEDVLPCFCTNCINYISNITRILHYQEQSNEKMNVEKMEINESDRIVNGLRRSIRTALEVGSAIKKKINSDYKPLIDTLNVALLSTFRLGEYLFTHSNSNSIDDTRESYKSESFTEINKSTYKSESFKSESYDTKLNNLQSYESNTTLNNSPTIQSNVQCNSPSTVQSNVQSTIPSTIQSNMESIRNESYMISNEMRENEEMEDVGELIYMDIGMESMSSTFENDQYLNYDIMSEDDGSSFTSLSSSSPKMFNKRKSPSRSRRPYRSLSSLENLPSSRRSTRDLSQTDDMYIYDMNNLSDKGEFEDWYNEDSDSSKKSVKYVQKRMPPSRPSVSNLTEIYGSQDMLIPMGPLPIGVYFDASRKLWRCQWRENGKFRTKGFSLGHYNTLADARHACILFRCQVGNMNIQPEWLTPNYIKVSELLNRKASQPSNNTPKKSNRKKKRQEDLYEPFS